MADLLDYLTVQFEHPLFAWEFLFNRWQEPEFTESAVLKAFAKETDGLPRKLSSVTLQQHFQVFLHTYVPARGQKGEIAEDNLDCPLTELELLLKIGERAPPGTTRREPVYAFRREEKPSISPGLFAYCVEDFWQKVSPNSVTLPVRTLASGIGSPGQVFKISRRGHQQSRAKSVGGDTRGIEIRRIGGAAAGSSVRFDRCQAPACARVQLRHPWSLPQSPPSSRSRHGIFARPTSSAIFATREPSNSTYLPLTLVSASIDWQRGCDRRQPSAPGA